MRHRIMFGCLMALYICSGFAYADPKPTEPVAPVVESSEILTHLNVKGLWFPMPVARTMLKDLYDGRSCLKLSSKLELRLETEIHQGRLLELQLASVNRELQIYKDTAESQAKTLANIADPPWYYSPYVWAIVGFAIGVGSATGIVFALK